jgi:hypothetical protein
LPPSRRCPAAAAVAAAATTNAVSVTVAAICWSIVVCSHRCLCFRHRCLPPPLPLLAAGCRCHWRLWRLWQRLWRKRRQRQ